MERDYSLVVEDGYEYTLTKGYMNEMSHRFVNMLFRVLRRPDEKNLNMHQLAKWYDLSEYRLGKSRLQRCKIKLYALWNILLAISVCLVVARRVRVPLKWALRMDVIAEDFYLSDLVNRHKTHFKKVEEFMCNEDILSIPIVVAEHDKKFYIEDGNHRYAARVLRGFSKVRAIRV